MSKLSNIIKTKITVYLVGKEGEDLDIAGLFQIEEGQPVKVDVSSLLNYLFLNIFYYYRSK